MKIRRFILCIILVVINFFSFGQNWEWARQGTYPGHSDTACEIVSINSDARSNLYEMGALRGRTVFGKDTLFGHNTYLVKYDSAGNEKWATQSIFSGHYDLSYGVSTVTDKAGNIYLCGDFADTIVFSKDSLMQNTIHDMFLVKYNSAGQLVWARCGKCADDFDQSYCGQITMDSSGYIYITGQMYDTVRFGPYTLSARHTMSVFLLKYDTAGNIIWAKMANSPPNNVINGGDKVHVDTAGYVYVAGEFSDTLIFDRDTIISQSPATFIAKYDSAGNVIWIVSSKKGVAYCSGETIDNAGNIYMSGYYLDTIYFGAHILTAPTYAMNSFIVKYTPSGTFIWAKPSHARASEDIYGYSLCSDKYNHIYLSGTFTFADTATFGTLLLKSDSAYPTFIVEYDSAGNVICGTIVNDDYDEPSPLANMPGDSGVYFGSQLNQYSHIPLGPDTVSLSNGADPVFVAKWKHYHVPTLTITASRDSICPGELVVLTANGVNGATYLWSPGGATTSSVTVNPVSTQAYTVTATVGIYHYSDSITITVIPLPAPVVSGHSRVCTGTRDTLQVSGGAGYQWSNGSTKTTYITGLINEDSTIYVTVYNMLGCSVTDTFKIDTMYCGLGIVQLSDEVNIKLLPNPNDGEFLIELEATGNPPLKLEIYNTWGEKIISQMLSPNLHQYPIDMSNYANGVYFYRVLKQDETLSGSGKLIIEK